MRLFIDRIVVCIPKVLCLFVGIVTMVFSIISTPYTQKDLHIEGVINKYAEDIRHVHHWKGGADYDIDDYYIIIDGVILDVPYLEKETFKGREKFWKEKLEGKYASVNYIQKTNSFIIHDIELEDGSYSYHDPHEISYYDVGWFPFCITAPIALFCIFVLLRYFYLLTFASDERRILVFGNKDGDLK